MQPYRPEHSKYRAKAHSKDATGMKAPWTVQKLTWGFFWKTIRVGEFTEMINTAKHLHNQSK